MRTLKRKVRLSDTSSEQSFTVQVRTSRVDGAKERAMRRARGDEGNKTARGQRSGETEWQEVNFAAGGSLARAGCNFARKFDIQNRK